MRQHHIPAGQTLSTTEQPTASPVITCLHGRTKRSCLPGGPRSFKLTISTSAGQWWEKPKRWWLPKHPHFIQSNSSVPDPSPCRLDKTQTEPKLDWPHFSYQNIFAVSVQIFWMLLHGVESTCEARMKLQMEAVTWLLYEGLIKVTLYVLL